MPDLPISTVEDLEERLSRPCHAVTETLAALRGDIDVLGAGGKMGPSLARMARTGTPGSLPPSCMSMDDSGFHRKASLAASRPPDISKSGVGPPTPRGRTAHQPAGRIFGGGASERIDFKREIVIRRMRTDDVLMRHPPASSS
jgi:hypothetical protein